MQRFYQVESRATVAPAMQVSVRQGSIGFTASFQASQNARYVQILVDASRKRLAFLFTPYQGTGSFTLASDSTKANPMKVVSCSALLRDNPWIAQGRYDAAQDHRKYWIVKLAENV